MRRAAALVALVLLAGCQGHPVRRALTATPSPTPSASATVSVTQAPTPTPSARPVVRTRPRPTASPSPSAHRTVAPAPRRTAAAVPLCHGVPSVGSAQQVVLVTGVGTTAVVRACRRSAGQWVSVFGTMYGHVGYNGVAPYGAKREGDGRTPSGVYTLGRGFGVLGDPGVRFGWRQVGPADVWVDDPRSSLYNTWQEKPADGRWQSAEPLDQSPAYDFAQVVDYNTARTPGLGSAIFFHVDHGGPTAGCVSLPRSLLLEVFRWEQPGAVIAIS